MNKSLLIVGMLLILNSNLVNADLLISPNPADITIRSNESSTFNLQLTNRFDFKILDLEFDSNFEGFSFPNSSLESNETKDYTINILRGDEGIKSLNGMIIFKYLVDLPEGTKTHNVNITDIGFNPNFIVIRKGDSILWNNLDTITRTATGATFDINIPANESRSYLFDEIGEFNYQDLILFSGGNIQVVNASNEEKVNNPIYDTAFRVNLEVVTDPTALDLKLTENDFTIEAVGSYESVLEINNIGNISAQRIKLTSEPNWISFSEQEFLIEPGQKNILTYTITPLILETIGTNKTYEINISAKGSNTEIFSKQIKVYVPFSATFDDINTNEGFFSFYTQYCNANPNTLICNNTIQDSGESKIIITDPTISVNLSSRELIEALRRIRSIEDSVLRTTNEQKLLSSKLDTDIPTLLRLINESVSKQKEVDDTSTARTRGFWVFILFVIIISSIILIGFSIRKYLYKRSLMDGGLIYRT